jgi:membrane-associated phospholipid phosphatase
LAIWNFVTDFGDSAVTVPLTLLTLIILLAAGQRRLALFWILAIGGCAVTIGTLKLIFGACGPPIAIGHIVSPSGHTAMSTAVFGSLALLVGEPLPVRQRRGIMIATAIGIAAIAVSRVALHEHDPAEVVIGLVVGAGAVMFFRTVIGRRALPALPFGWLLLCGAAVIAAMHGTRWMVEPTVHRLAWDFRFALPWCH